MKKIIKIIMITLLMFFFSLYFSRYIGYQDNKSILTDAAIKRFEKDLREGKEIDPNNYIIEEKDYNNKASRIGRKTSKIIEKSFTKSLKYIMRYLGTIE